MSEQVAASTTGPTRRNFLGTVLPGGLAASALAVAALRDVPAEAATLTVQGSWQVRVTFAEPPPGSPPQHWVLMAFHTDGITQLVSTSDRVGVGVWRPTGLRAFTFLSYQHFEDPETGELIGFIHTRHNGTLDETGNGFTSSGTGTIYDANTGEVIIPPIVTSAVGTRIVL